MIDLLITLILVVLIVGVLWWATNALANAFGLPAQIITVLQVLIVLVAVFFLLTRFRAVPGF